MLIITMLIKITMFIVDDWQMQDLPVDVVGVDIF